MVVKEQFVHNARDGAANGNCIHIKCDDAF